MALVAPSPPRFEDDPRRQPGAYIALEEKHLYCVIESEPTGLACENCRTGYIIRLSVTSVEQARLIQAAPVLVVPDTLPADDQA